MEKIRKFHQHMFEERRKKKKTLNDNHIKLMNTLWQKRKSNLFLVVELVILKYPHLFVLRRGHQSQTTIDMCQ